MVRWGDMGRLSFWFFPKKSCSFVRPTHCDEAWSLFGVDFSARRRMGVVASILLHLKSNRARRREKGQGDKKEGGQGRRRVGEGRSRKKRARRKGERRREQGEKENEEEWGSFGQIKGSQKKEEASKDTTQTHTRTHAHMHTCTHAHILEAGDGTKAGESSYTCKTKTTKTTKTKSNR